MSEKEVTYNKKNKKKLISNLIFLGLVVILMITLVCSLGDVNKIFSAMGRVGENNNWVYFIIAIVLVLFYIALWPLSLCVFAKKNLPEATFKDSYLIGCSEHFYNGVTPFAAGGQPFQVYSYAKKGCKASTSTSVVLANFVTFMMVTNLIALISLVFWGSYTGSLKEVGEAYNMDLTWFKVVAIIGFAINFLVLVFMICLGCSKKIRNAIIGLTKLLAKIKFLKKPLTKALPALEEYCTNAQIGFKGIAQDIPTFIKAFLLKLVAMIIYYAIPFFLMMSIGMRFKTFEEFILVFFGGPFAITSVVFMPTPGGSLGIELAFAIVIASIAAKIGYVSPSGLNADSQAVTMLWRLLTFYFVILVSFIFSICYEYGFNKLEKNKEAKQLADINQPSSEEKKDD